MKRTAHLSVHWKPITKPHRCTRPDCTAPAVAVSYTVRKAGAWRCEQHLADLRSFIRHGRVWVAVHDGEPLADLKFTPPAMQRRKA